MTRRSGHLVVGLLWHCLRAPNLGWGAMTVSHLGMLKEAARATNQPIQILLISPEVDDDTLWYPPVGITFDEVRVKLKDKRSFRRETWRALSKCDVVLDISAGDLFSDIYGKEIFYCLLFTKVASLIQRKPLVLAPQTIGPFKSNWVRFLAKHVISRCAQVFTRDVQSLALLRAIGASHRAQDVLDLAFRLPFRRPAREASSTVLFGLNVSGLVYALGSGNGNVLGLKVDYPRLIEQLIESLLRRSDVHLILIPHVVGKTIEGNANDDLWICKALADRFGVQVCPTFSSPVEAKSFISGLDLLASARMHATIAALSSEVPVVPMAYSQKFNGLFSSLQYPLICDLTVQDDISNIVSRIHTAIDNLPALRSNAVASNAIAQCAVNHYQNYLNEMLTHRAAPQTSQAKRMSCALPSTHESSHSDAPP